MPTKVIPFSIEAYEAGGKPVCRNRDFKVLELHVFEEEANDGYQIAAMIMKPFISKVFYRFHIDGSRVSDTMPVAQDLLLEVTTSNTFNLEAALAGAPCGTEDGKYTVQEIHHFKTREKHHCLLISFKEVKVIWIGSIDGYIPCCGQLVML